MRVYYTFEPNKFASSQPICEIGSIRRVSFILSRDFDSKLTFATIRIKIIYVWSIWNRIDDLLNQKIYFLWLLPHLRRGGGCLNNYQATTLVYRRKRIIHAEMPPLITKITNKNAILLLLPKFIIQIYCVVIKLGFRSAGLNIQYRFAMRRIVN